MVSFVHRWFVLFWWMFTKYVFVAIYHFINIFLRYHAKSTIVIFEEIMANIKWYASGTSEFIFEGFGDTVNKVLQIRYYKGKIIDMNINILPNITRIYFCSTIFENQSIEIIKYFCMLHFILPLVHRPYRALWTTSVYPCKVKN